MKIRKNKKPLNLKVLMKVSRPINPDAIKSLKRNNKKNIAPRVQLLLRRMKKLKQKKLQGINPKKKESIVLKEL